MASASALSISTMTGGPISMWRTTRTQARSIATIATASFKDVAVEAGCAYSQDGKPQAGMGLALGDYDRNGTIDIFKTNFAGDTSTLYANTGEGLCEDHTFASGIGIEHPLARMGRGFLDSTMTAGSTSSSPTATSIPRWNS